MTVDHKFCESFVLAWLHGVSDDDQNVETGENGFREFDILTEWYCSIISAANGIGRRHDSAPSLQGRNNTSFADGDGLLLHSFVDTGSILIIHLVKLIDQAGSPVRKHESTTFKRPLRSQRIAAYGCCQANSGRPLASCEYCSMSSLFHVLQHLRLCRTRIS